MSDTHQAAKAIAIALCEKWFDTGARASWSPAMADEFAKALTQAEQRGMERAIGVIDEHIVGQTDPLLLAEFTQEGPPVLATKDEREQLQNLLDLAQAIRAAKETL